ncbi:MAG: hypothetical protein HWN65_21695 [Candidatus Helarchaeota archaeon]|nr:hypothetical protein [Candidatus Helarchaeota archaeon]
MKTNRRGDCQHEKFRDPKSRKYVCRRCGEVLKRKLNPGSHRLIKELLIGLSVGVVLSLILWLINPVLGLGLGVPMTFFFLMRCFERLKNLPLFVYEPKDLADKIPKQQKKIPEELLEYADKDCLKCKGFGICVRCGGSGQDKENVSGDFKCPSCNGFGACTCLLSKIF